MKQPRRKETENASESSTRRKSRCHRPPGRENRGRGQGRHARPLTGSKDRRGGRCRHPGTRSPPANLTLLRAASSALSVRRLSRGSSCAVGRSIPLLGLHGPRNTLTFGWDVLAVAVLSLAVYALAIRGRLPVATSRAYVGDLTAEAEAEPEAEAAAESSEDQASRVRCSHAEPPASLPPPADPPRCPKSRSRVRPRPRGGQAPSLRGSLRIGAGRARRDRERTQRPAPATRLL
jgi:hypothetical protein